MPTFGMVGTTFRRAGQAELAAFTVAPAAQATALPALHHACGVSESVYLATCNRVELIFCLPPGLTAAAVRRQMYDFFHPQAAGDPQAAARALHAYDSEGACEHLFAVAASLDSMRPGEAQILGQVKDALRVAQGRGLAKAGLSLLFEEAFQAAKRVRHVTRLGAGNTSLVSLAARDIAARLPATGGRLVILGAGEMAQQCGQIFADTPGLERLFVNRTLAGATALAARFGGRAAALADWLAAPSRCDVVVLATAAPAPLLDAAALARLPPPAPLLVDLAVQRNVDPAAAAAIGAVLLDLDGLSRTAEGHRAARQDELAAARLVVDEALAALRRRLVERDLGPVVRELRAMYQATMEEELAALTARGLAPADPAAQARLGAWARGLVNRLAHVPTVGLKHLATEHGPDAAAAFVAGASRDVRPPPGGAGRSR